MIYTVTINPALDYYLYENQLAVGEINRSVREEFRVGGKGINVSLVLSSMGIASTATGFVGGFTGKEIENQLRRSNVCADFIQLAEGISRVNVKIRADKETDLNANGPVIAESELEALLDKLSGLSSEDTLVLSGSIPGQIRKNYYEQILRRVKTRGVRTVVDAEKDLLLSTLSCEPFLIKPNHHELGAIFHTACEDENEILDCAGKLKALGARNVLVSRGKRGAILLCESGEVMFCEAPKVVCTNTTGAGDSSVAGFLAGFDSDQSYQTALAYSIACGSAAVSTGKLAEREAVHALLPLLQVEKLYNNSQ